LDYQLGDEVFADFVHGSRMSVAEMDQDRPQRMAMGPGRELGIQVIDLRPAFGRWAVEDGAGLYVIADGHWTEAGHRLVAQAATRDLLASGVVTCDRT
jgi:hypothetical protein